MKEQPLFIWYTITITDRRRSKQREKVNAVVHVADVRALLTKSKFDEGIIIRLTYGDNLQPGKYGIFLPWSDCFWFFLFFWICSLELPCWEVWRKHSERQVGCIASVTPALSSSWVLQSIHPALCWSMLPWEAWLIIWEAGWKLLQKVWLRHRSLIAWWCQSSRMESSADCCPTKLPTRYCWNEQLQHRITVD